jgi:hypothetical protein
MWECKIEMSKQLRIGEVKEARAFFSQDIGHERDKIMKWDVAMVSLVEGAKVEQIHDRAGGGGRALALPCHGSGVI